VGFDRQHRYNQFIGQKRLSTSASLKFKFKPIFDQYYRFLLISVKPVMTDIIPPH
jgi:hypothetical protein